MEMTVLKAIALVLFSMVAAMSVLSIIRGMRRVTEKRAAERKLQVALHYALNEPEFRSMIERMEKEIAATGGVDAEIYAKLLEKVTEAAKQLNVPERSAVFGGVYQPSQRGRVRYMHKIVEDSKNPIVLQHRATG